MMTAVGKTTILVVEDEPALRRTVLRALGRAGYEVLLADRAEDALERVDLGQTIHLIICDLHLPTMDGMDLYQQLRERGFAGRFILTSGDEPDDAQRPAGVPPQIAFLGKPWTLESLTSSVRAALAG
jgi:CheY-like chemotaxis protein